MGRLSLFDFNNDIKIKLVNVISYDLLENTAVVYIQPDSEQVECTYVNEGKEIKGEIKDNYICFWENETLTAYINIHLKDGKVFIGIALSPDNCGKGLGKTYLKNVLQT